MRAEKKVCFCKELQIQKGIAFQFGLEGSCAFLFKFLRFMSDLNIHVTGSQLLREVLNCRSTMADISNSRFTPTALQLKNCIMLGINRVIPFLEGSRKDASLRLLKFSGFDLNSSQ